MTLTISTVDQAEASHCFYEDYFLRGRPVLVRGGARRMPAFSSWTDSYLKEALAGLKPMVRFEDGQFASIAIETFLHYLAGPERYCSSRGLMYLTDFYISPDFGDSRRARLARHAAFPLKRYRRCAEWISLYAGPAGTSSEFHQDVFSTHTWLAQLRGTKLWRLSAPAPGVPESALREQAEEVLVEAGDLLYLPPDWWHEVLNITATLAISGNFCSFRHAQAALREAENSRSTNREVWVATWREILSKSGEWRK